MDVERVCSSNIMQLAYECKEVRQLVAQKEG